jgi:uncharacterized membrane protein YgdD (TMEM256/DUF423 family)
MTAHIRTAATLAALAIALGAFGAHGLEKTFAAVGEKAAGWWQTAVFYHLTHAIALFAIAARGRDHFPKAGWYFILAGILIFSGTLYIMALTGITKLGMITPLGGLSLIIGWILVAKKG